MKVAQLLVAVVALAGSCGAGLLRVPRVYNALISTNQRLAPSRADTVSLPVVGPVALLPAAVVAEEAAPPPAGKNATEAEDLAPAANHTLVAPLAVYSPYYYHPAYPYPYNPYLVPPVAPLVHYGYSYNYLPVLPLAVAHPVPAVAPKPDDKNAGDAKADAEKDAVTVEAN